MQPRNRKIVATARPVAADGLGDVVGENGKLTASIEDKVINERGVALWAIPLFVLGVYPKTQLLLFSPMKR